MQEGLEAPSSLPDLPLVTLTETLSFVYPPSLPCPTAQATLCLLLQQLPW